MGRTLLISKAKKAKAKPETGSDWETNVLRMELENKKEAAGSGTGIAWLQRPGLGVERNLRLQLRRELVRNPKQSEDSTQIKGENR